MNKLKKFKIGLFTITLGMVLVGASFALADDKAVAEGIILPEELNETTAILAPSVAIAENEPTTQPEEWIDAVAQRLAHFCVAHKQPAVSVHLLG